MLAQAATKWWRAIGVIVDPFENGGHPISGEFCEIFDSNGRHGNARYLWTAKYGHMLQYEWHDEHSQLCTTLFRYSGKFNRPWLKKL